MIFLVVMIFLKVLFLLFWDFCRKIRSRLCLLYDENLFDEDLHYEFDAGGGG
jgi:hypothetical protein